MIVFDLACKCGYHFEGWFQDRQDFEDQQSASFVVCPECGGRSIRKVLSPIRTTSPQNSKTAPPKAGSDAEVPKGDAVEALRTLQKFVEENFEDVGTELASESLKIHYGVAEPRNLCGITTPAEEKKLKEEGIELLKIPMPSKNSNVN